MRETILIADPNPTSRLILRARLTAALYQPLMASDAGACLQIAAGARPALILIDDQILAGEAGCGLIRQLRSEALTCRMPLIQLSAQEDRAARLKGLEAGADDVIMRSHDTSVLLARIGNLLRRAQPNNLLTEAWGQDPPALTGFAEQLSSFHYGSSPGTGTGTWSAAAGSIGVIADSTEAARLWRHRIPEDLRLRAHVQSPGPGPAESRVHDICLICAEGGETGDDPAGRLRLLSRLSGEKTGRDSLCCLVLPQMNAAAVALAFDLGADDVIPGDISATELGLRLQNMLRRKAQRDGDQLRIREGLKLAMIDPLTGAWNRRYALPRLSRLCEEARASGQPLGVMVIDIDRFKRVNDLHGHLAGDLILTEVVHRLRSALRGGDLLARIGGEEFLVALPGSGAAEASSVAERLRRVISAEPFDLGPDPAGNGALRLPLTISLGLRISSGTEEALALTEAADAALRESKRAGRNMVTLCQSQA